MNLKLLSGLFKTKILSHNKSFIEHRNDVICILQWGEHYAVLSRLAVRQTLMVNQLVDMEWKFGGKTSHLAFDEIISYCKSSHDFY